jgi:hypothetical protein
MKKTTTCDLIFPVKLKCVCVCMRVHAGYNHYKEQLSIHDYKHCPTNLIALLHLWKYSCGRRKLLVPRRAQVLGP